jgi:hypothetical protein
VAVELNSRSEVFANRFFASYNRFRDYRLPFSTDYPTLEVGEAGVTYTTIGHEPFSIHNILDQDVWQFTNNFSYYKNKHVITVGANFEYFKFFNSFNLFRHGLFGLPFAETTIPTLEQFFDVTDPESENYIDFNAFTASETAPFKGEIIETAQISFYAQDEFLAADNFNVTFGLRVDVPMYFTDPVANPFSTGEADNPVTGQPNQWRGPDGQTIELDQAKLAGATALLSPRVGFNWDVNGDRSTQLRGGLGVFTGRVPFVWIGNVISNPGANPNLPPEGGAANADDIITLEGRPNDPTNQEDRQEQYSRLSQSFDLNAMADDFKWPQVFTANLALDKRLPGGFVGTIEVLYSKDLNSVYVYNADLNTPGQRTLADGRPYYGSATGENEINADFGAGAFVIDNSDEGYNYSVTGQLRKTWESGLNLSLAYTYLKAKSLMKNTEIASVLFNENPVQGNPNQPGLGYSEFGNRHRIIAAGTYARTWSPTFTTKFGLFFEAAEGNKFLGAGGNRYSFTYSGDVNGDGAAGNDLIYIPRSQEDINLATFTDDSGNIYTSNQQWEALDAFIEQDAYLSKNRGKIAERFGGVNPWFWNVDLRILQDINLNAGGRTHTLQLSLDILNLPNLISSSWGVRKVATPAATSPLTLQEFDAEGEPVFTFQGAAVEDFSTYVDSPDILSRWQLQLGIRYIFN